MTRIETFKRDNLLVDIIFQHKGKENAIGTKELVLALEKAGYKETPERIHSLVTKAVYDRHVPICSLLHRGYYWGTSKQDVQAAIDELQEKINGLQEHIDFLKNFICE